MNRVPTSVGENSPAKAPFMVRRMAGVAGGGSYRCCSRCVMDTSDPQIAFDAESRCNHCTEFLEVRSRFKYHGRTSDEALEREIEKIKAAGRGRTYDCVIGVSGGADSSFVAIEVVKRGLRPLAVHMDNGWDSETAVTNIRNLVDRLGIDYESVVLDWEEFRDLQLSFLKASVPEAETPTDVAIPAAVHRLAAKHGIKYVISGGNVATEGILPKSWHYNARDLTYLKHIHRSFGSRPLGSFPTFGFAAESYYKVLRGIKTFYFLNYVPFFKAGAKQRLRAEFGWKDYGGKHHESRYTKFIQSYYLIKKFGIDYRRATFSALICGDEMTREEALAELEVPAYEPAEVEQEKRYIAKKLAISLEELEEIVSAPPKYYWDYPNSDERLTMLYNAYRRIFKLEKLSTS